MARPRGMTSRPSPPDDDRDGEGRAAPGVPDPLDGWTEGDGARGPESTLRREMIAVIAREVASGATKRAAAATAGTTEDCLGAWLKRGKEMAGKRKRGKYTQLLIAYEKAEAHYQRFLRGLGVRSVTDRHCNPRFITYSLGVRDPKNWTIPRDGAPAGRGAGAVLELLTPAQARQALEERLERFLSVEDERNRADAEAAAGPPPVVPGGR
jgi:hypothetical protein